MGKDYQICTRCVMDTSDKDINFDENGVCNHCRSYEEKLKKYVLTGKEAEKKLWEIAEKIKERGKTKKYDCLLGLSGGTDSTYVAYVVKKLGLRPLIVHLDNGWNSRTSVGNIKNIVKKLGFDLYTYVIDWDEFRELQLAYLRASVVDIEFLTDHAIKAILYKVASDRGIKEIITGTNIVTEGMMPKSWVYSKNDVSNLKDIVGKFSSVKIKTFPVMGFYKQLYYHFIKGIRTIQILNYVPYIKKDAKDILKKELGWVDYGDKHGESVFTSFYQKYILIKKFGIDKRRPHLSTLICAGQITREEAIKEIEKSPYTEQELKKEKEYVMKKFGINEKEFEDIMSLPVRSHYEFKNQAFTRKIVNSLRKLL